MSPSINEYPANEFSADYSSQQTMIADDAIPTVQIQDETGQDVPVEDIEQQPHMPAAGMLSTLFCDILLPARQLTAKLTSQRRKSPQ